MRRSAPVLLACMAVFVLGGIGVSAAGPSAAGSSKDAGGDVHCGTKGQLPVSVTSIRGYANQTSDGAEVEACNDAGPGNTHGRLNLRVRANGNPSTSGARATLDSDKDQPFPAGYINVQASGQGSGVWCSEDTGANSVGDGYAQPWSQPGKDGTAGNEPDDEPREVECLPVVGE